MTLQNFIISYDRPGSVILLEGKRAVHSEDRQKLILLGALLATKSKHMIFRSGNAPGADEYFSEGVAQCDKSRLQIITPYSGYRRKANLAADTIALDDIDLMSEPEVVYQSKSQKKNERIIEQYVEGKQNRNSAKAAYLLRDTIKVIGTAHVAPASFAIFYDDLQNPRRGGTGHTMQVCNQNSVPSIDQQVWFEWVGRT